MTMSLLEVTGFSILFLLTAVPLFAVSYAAFVIVFHKRGIALTKPFHWIDLAMPMIATLIWVWLQANAVHNKSMGNLAEISLMGLVWGLLFVYRCVMVVKERSVPIWELVLFSCVIFAGITLLSPTFPE